MEASYEGGQVPEGATAPYMEWRRLMGAAKARKGLQRLIWNGGVLLGRPRPGKGFSAIYGMEASYEGGQGTEGAAAPYIEWRRLMGEAKARKGP